MNKFPKLAPIFFPDDTKEVKPDNEHQTGDPYDDWKFVSTNLREPLLETLM